MVGTGAVGRDEGDDPGRDRRVPDGGFVADRPGFVLRVGVEREGEATATTTVGPGMTPTDGGGVRAPAARARARAFAFALRARVTGVSGVVAAGGDALTTSPAWRSVESGVSCGSGALSLLKITHGTAAAATTAAPSASAASVRGRKLEGGGFILGPGRTGGERR